MNIQKISLFLFCVALLGTPLFLKDPYFLEILIFIGIYSLIAMGLNLLMGYAGQISLGHAAFYAIGAYTVGLLTTRFHIPFFAAAGAALLLTGIVAYLIGVPSLKLKGHYLAMATLAFGEIVYICLNAAVDITGGPSGIAGIPQLQIGGFVFNTETRYFYLVWTITILFFIFTRNLIQSRTGRALRSIHGSETAASAMGINVSAMKIRVFVISALYASLAGILYAHYITFISPQMSDLTFSIRLVTMVVVGGMGYLWGGILGTALLLLLPQFLTVFEDYEMLTYGLILLFMVMFLPSGLAGGGRTLLKKLTQKHKEAS